MVPNYIQKIENYQNIIQTPPKFILDHSALPQADEMTICYFWSFSSTEYQSFWAILVLIWPSLHKNTTTGCSRYVQKLKKIQKLSKHHPNSSQIHFGPLNTSQSLPNDKFQKKVWKVPLKWAIFCQIAPPLILLMFGVFWYFEVLNLKNLMELILYNLQNLWSTPQPTSDPNIVTIKTNKDL